MAHAGRVTLMVQDLRSVEDVINVMAGQPDGATQEEIRRHLNQDGGAPRGAPPAPPAPPPPGAAPPAPPPPGGASPPGGAPHPSSVFSHQHTSPPPSPGGAPPGSGAPPHRQRASSHHSPPANAGSDSDSDNSDNPRSPGCRLYDNLGSTSRTSGSGTMRGAGGVVRQGNLVGSVGSGMGDVSGSEEGDARGAQGDHNTGHVGTGWGGGSAGAGAGGSATN